MAHLLYVGIDVALKQNRARFVDDTEADDGRLAFPNDAGGAVSPVAQTCRLLTRHQFPPGSLRVGGHQLLRLASGPLPHLAGACLGRVRRGT